MTLCEFCTLQQAEGRCSYGHPIPKKMRCIGFTPGIERFCSTPADYSGRGQLKQMALYFGMKGKELKRVLALGDAVQSNLMPLRLLPLTLLLRLPRPRIQKNHSTTSSCTMSLGKIRPKFSLVRKFERQYCPNSRLESDNGRAGTLPGSARLQPGAAAA